MSKSQSTLENAVRPLYAVAGATDLAVEIARGYVEGAQVRVTGAQKGVQKRVAAVQSVDLEPKALQDRAVTLVNARVDQLTTEAKAFPGKVEAYVNGTVADLSETYAELAQRGEKLVTRIRRQQATQDAVDAVKNTTARAKATHTSVETGASATTSRAKATATTAKKGASATKSRAKATSTTAKKATTRARSNAKATGTTAKKAASQTVKAVEDGAEKIG